MERPLQKIDKKIVNTKIVNDIQLVVKASESFIGISLPRERPSGYTPQDLYSLKTSNRME